MPEISNSPPLCHAILIDTKYIDSVTFIYIIIISS